VQGATEVNGLSERQAREARYHDAVAAGLDPALMPPRPLDEWERGLIEAAGELAGRRVLEVGCGDGGLSLALLERGADLTAIDLSPRMVEVARARAERFRPDARASFLSASAEETGAEPASCDLVIGKWVLHHVDLDRTAAELARVLAPGGRGVFAESSALNPALAWARRRLAGRYGVASYGTPDERPLATSDFDLLASRFASVRLEFPNFWLVRMLDRHLLRNRWPLITRLCRQADSYLARRLPRLRRYGYWVLVEVRAAP